MYRLDLNNTLLVGLPQCLIAKIQRCQNTAAGIVTCQTCHITPILRELDRLPVRYRIHYKVLLHVYRALIKWTVSRLSGEYSGVVCSIPPPDVCRQPAVDYPMHWALG